MGAEMGLDVAEFDAVPTHLDLVIQPPLMFEQAVIAPAAAVSGAVQPSLGNGAERIDDEAIVRQFGPVQVAQRDAGAADVDLARHADRAKLALFVKDVDLRVRNRAADADAALGVLHTPTA